MQKLAATLNAVSDAREADDWDAVKTTVEEDDLARLGMFLTDLANLKKCSAAHGNDTVLTDR